MNRINKKKVTLVAMTIMIMATITFSTYINIKSTIENKKDVDVDIEPEKDVEQVPDWEIMKQALIVIESEGNPLAVGKTQDLGILQITSIYVEEVNRILGEHRYDLSHRLDIEHSLEMFEIYQAFYNPEKDIQRAINLHNPGAGPWYLDKVMEMFKTLKEFNHV